MPKLKLFLFIQAINALLRNELRIKMIIIKLCWPIESGPEEYFEDAGTRTWASRLSMLSELTICATFTLTRARTRNLSPAAEPIARAVYNYIY